MNYLRECIQSIYQHADGLTFEIIVIDSGSPNDDVDTLRDQFPEIKLIKSGRNIGFAAANNLAFRDSCGEHVLFLNPDTLLTGPAIQTVLGWSRALPDAGVLGCKLLNSDLSVQTSSIQRYPTILNQMIDIEYLRLRWPGFRLWAIGPLFTAPAAQPVRVESISGAFMLMRRKVFETSGLFSEEYFMYAEDIDLCHKAALAGFTNYFVAEATVIHHGGKSSGQRKAKQWATIMKFRAMAQFCVKTHGKTYSLLFRTAMGCAAAARLAVMAIMVPFGSKVIDFGMASAKWTAVLAWAAGLDHCLLIRSDKGSES